MIALLKALLWLWGIANALPSMARRLFKRRRRTPLARICAARKRLGTRGERIARNVLEERGMEFLAANYRHGHCEIDIVMRDGDDICFVEVKTRSRRIEGRPADAVGPEKQRNVLRAARGYMRAVGRPRVECRFDIVEVLFDRGRLSAVTHIRNAFVGHPTAQ